MNMHSELVVDITDLKLVGIPLIELKPFASRGTNPVLVDLTGSQSLIYVSGNFGVLNENDIGFMADRDVYKKILDIAESQYNSLVFARPKHIDYFSDIIGKVNARILKAVIELYNGKNCHSAFAKSTIKVKE